MNKVAGILLALIIVGVVVTTRTHTTAGPICPAKATRHAARTVAPRAPTTAPSTARHR